MGEWAEISGAQIEDNYCELAEPEVFQRANYLKVLGSHALKTTV